MLRTLAIDPRVPLEHGFIIRKQALAEHVRAHVTVEQARTHARHLLKAAQEHADTLHKQARIQGFDEGLRDSLSSIYQALQDMQHLYTQIEENLKTTFKEAIRQALQEPTLELNLIKGWLATSPTVSPSLHVILPKRAASQSQAIIHDIETQLRITPYITLSDSTHTVIECGNQVFEFSPTRTMQEMETLARGCVHTLDVKKQVHAWRAHIVQQWLSKLAERHPIAASDDIDDLDSDDEWDD